MDVSVCRAACSVQCAKPCPVVWNWEGRRGVWARESLDGLVPSCVEWKEGHRLWADLRAVEQWAWGRWKRWQERPVDRRERGGFHGSWQRAPHDEKGNYDVMPPTCASRQGQKPTVPLFPHVEYPRLDRQV